MRSTVACSTENSGLVVKAVGQSPDVASLLFVWPLRAAQARPALPQ